MNDLKIKALKFAGIAHQKDVRKGGLPYILHPVSVGLKLLENFAYLYYYKIINNIII